jgi:hypothetical protein
MNLQIGKTYKSRSGRYWYIAGRYEPNNTFIGICLADNVEAFFYADGTRWFRPDTAEDLVEEVV